MCLRTIARRGLDEEGEGWKIFEKRGSDLVGVFMCITGCSDIYPEEEWVKDCCRRSLTTASALKAEYPAGFHIFTSEEAALYELRLLKTACLFSADRFILKRVKYRHGHTLGEDLGGETIVAREMYVCAKVTEEKQEAKEEVKTTAEAELVGVI